MRISIIVPVLNEAAILEKFLRHLRDVAPAYEIIVVDGESEDASCTIARELADRVLQVRRGRARQMNAGAELARGDVLWFVHADSEVPQDSLETINQALSNPKMVGGCFRLQIASARPIFRTRDAIANFLVDVFGIAFGDRGLFCRRQTFAEIGGYPELGVLEDAEFYRRLRARGQVVQVKQTIRTSSRRYMELGPLATMFFYTLVVFLYALRVPHPILEKIICAFMKRRVANGAAPGRTVAAAVPSRIR
jgi:rSAM/selenodomain-associated transferase 2